MSDIEYVFGIGDGIAGHWYGHGLADTSVADALWIDYDAGIEDAPWPTGVSLDDDIPDIPLATVDYRKVLAQEPVKPPWHDGN
ncbi:hypothetical protein [Nocardia lasii]|uniref:Uncharacterized protein n=1 Tax=Nocardia lasii TaxID=1616107 RepID=A0ABW1JRM3_9NOCA